MADGSVGGWGYEQAYATKQVYPGHVAAMTREERRAIIENYKNAVTPTDQANLLSTSPEGGANTAAGSGGEAGQQRWDTTNGNVVASAQKNIAKIGGLFKRKKSVSQQQDEPVASKSTEQTGGLSLKKSISNKDTQGFQKLADE